MKKTISLVLALFCALSLAACGARSVTDGDAYVFYASNGDAYYYASDGNAYHYATNGDAYCYSADGNIYYVGNIIDCTGIYSPYATDGDAYYSVTDGDAVVTDGDTVWTTIYVATDGDAADHAMYLRGVYDSLWHNVHNIVPEEFARALVEIVSVMTPEDVQRVTTDWLAPLGSEERDVFTDYVRSLRDWCAAYSLSIGQEQNESLDMVYTVLGLR